MIPRLALAGIVALLTALAVAGRTDEGTVRIILFGHSAMSVIALLLNVTGRQRLRSMIGRIRDAVPVVATGLIEAPPVDVASLIAEVRRLGFEMGGATDTTLGGPPVRTWVLLEPAGETWVEIGSAAQPMAIFLSESSGGRLIETSYPYGEAIDDPKLRARPVSTGTTEALAAHREAVREAGGSQRAVVTLDDYLAAERDQRVQTGGMRIRSHLETSVVPAIRDWSISVAVDVLAFAALTFL